MLRKIEIKGTHGNPWQPTVCVIESCVFGSLFKVLQSFYVCSGQIINRSLSHIVLNMNL